MTETDTKRCEDTPNERERWRLVLTPILPGRSGCWPLQRRLVLGRGEDCSHVIREDHVSRHHAEIVPQGPVVTVKDLGSKNGTFLDGKRASHGVLKPGALLRIGDWLGLVEYRSDAEHSISFGEVAPGLFGGIEVHRAFVELSRGALSQLPVVIHGETGAGKERFAAAVHAESKRRGPFHAVNCATLTPALADALMFGHARGAFTGAHQAAIGHVRAADGGTLFLDELAELPLPVQAKLLRVLETKLVTPVGETKSTPVDVRLVAALQQRPADLVQERRLRQDLVARLSGFVVRVPPLRERRGDIPSLFHRFVRSANGGSEKTISSRLYEALTRQEWPDNVRALELLAARLVAVNGSEPALRRSHLPESMRVESSGEGEPDGAVYASRNQRDRELLARALERNGGNMKQSAAAVGISRQRAYRLLAEASATPSIEPGAADRDE